MTTSTATRRILEGHAATFNTPTTIAAERKFRFTESISPGAFKVVLLSQPPDRRTAFLVNHSVDRLLGRAGENLVLSEDDHGLAFRLELPSTPLADEVLELVARRILTAMSFSFVVGKETWFDGPKGEDPHRRIEAVSMLVDVSCCTFGAYSEPAVKVGRGSLPSARVAERVAKLEATLRTLRTGQSPKAARRSALPVGRPIPPPPWAQSGVIRRGCGHSSPESTKQQQRSVAS